jgi:predicted  nucleic acid-binding Zn-ribbon protein
MPIPTRNKDGSLSYKQTADELKNVESQRTLKQLNREFKRLSDTVDSLSSELAIIKNKINN